MSRITDRESQFQVPGFGYQVVAEAVVAFFRGDAEALGFVNAAGGVEIALVHSVSVL